MYDQSPQFGFTGSSLPGLPTTLDNINPMYYQQLFGFLSAKYGAPANARLASINGVELYDTLRVDPGVIPLREFVFFQTPVGQLQGLFVAGTQYTKQDIDIHNWVVQGGQLALGYEALIWNIGVQFHIVGSLDDTVQTTGNGIGLANLIGLLTGEAAGDPVKMGNLLRAFQESMYFELFVNQTTFELGPGWRFPAGIYGGSGFASSTGTAAAAQTDGYINNGFGWAYQLPIMRHIPSQTKFGVRMKSQNSFSTVGSLDVRVVVTLGGIGVQPVTG